MIHAWPVQREEECVFLSLQRLISVGGLCHRCLASFCRRVVGDMVDDMDMKRKKSLALVTGRLDTDFDMSAARHPIQAQRSSSSKVQTLRRSGKKNMSLAAVRQDNNNNS